MLFLYLVLLLFTIGCNNESSSTDNTIEKENTLSQKSEPDAQLISSNKSSDLQSGETIFAWVNKLNVRKAPNTKAEIITTVGQDDPLIFVGKKSDQKETIVLRSMAYHDHWLQVETKDNNIGWVFGGTVRQKNELKGNTETLEDRINIPLFGNFNLKEWEKISTKDELAGDAETITTIYKKDNQIIEISKIDVGKYGYSRIFKLMNENKKLIKSRILEFVVAPDFLLTETITDYRSNTKKKHSRSQKMDKHFMQMNALPLMVNGTWNTELLLD